MADTSDTVDDSDDIGPSSALSLVGGYGSDSSDDEDQARRGERTRTVRSGFFSGGGERDDAGDESDGERSRSTDVVAQPVGAGSQAPQSASGYVAIMITNQVMIMIIITIKSCSSSSCMGMDSLCQRQGEEVAATNVCRSTRRVVICRSVVRRIQGEMICE
jgi:hypothetical protein